MTAKFLLKNYKIIIGLIGLMVFIVSVLADMMDYKIIFRSLRVFFGILIIVLIVIGKKWKENTVLAYFLIATCAASFLIMFFEKSILVIPAVIFNILGYLLLTLGLYRKSYFVKVQWYILLGFLAIMSINFYLMYQVVRVLQEVSLDVVHSALLMINTFVIAATALLALIYNYFYSTRSSMTFIVFLTLYIFSELFRAVGYYNLMPGYYTAYIGRALFITSFGALFHFMVIDKKKEETLKWPF